jgi:hypothetical protein
MLVLGVVLDQLLAWVRTHPGTRHLRALLVFDEVYGFVPPHPKDPPTKKPLISLLKQARAYGLGVVLANPWGSTGVAAYTLGQRKGLGIAVGEPRYVTAIDPVANIVEVGPEELLFSDEVTIEAARWVSGAAPEVGASIEAKARYKAEPAAAVVEQVAGERAKLRFEKRQRALTPGQAVCVYSGDEVLGGGTIVSTDHR